MKPSRPPPPQGNGPLPVAVPLATSEAASEPVCFQRCREMGAGPLELRPWLASQGCDGGGGRNSTVNYISPVSSGTHLVPAGLTCRPTPV